MSVEITLQRPERIMDLDKFITVRSSGIFVAEAIKHGTLRTLDGLVYLPSAIMIDRSQRLIFDFTKKRFGLNPLYVLPTITTETPPWQQLTCFISTFKKSRHFVLAVAVLTEACRTCYYLVGRMKSSICQVGRRMLG